MFWKRNEKIDFTAKGEAFICPPPPQKKQFATMLEMLRDSEKYDNAGEKYVSIAILTNLCEFIERYKANSRS